MYYDKWWKSHGRWPESGDCEFASKFCLSKMGPMLLLESDRFRKIFKGWSKSTYLKEIIVFCEFNE